MKLKKIFSDCPLDNERGIVLVISMLLLIVLTLIGVAAISTSNFDILLSDARKRQHAAFYAAEAGISHAKVLLQGQTVEGEDMVTWSSDLLNGATSKSAEGGSDLITDQVLDANYTYSVKVYNNEKDSLGNATTDGDGIIIVRSTSSPRKALGGSAIVEVALQGYYTYSVKEEYAQEGAGAHKNYNANDAGIVALDDGKGNLSSQLGVSSDSKK